MFCSRCGTQLVEGAAFCPRCGAQVAPVAGQAAAMVGQPPITVEVSPKSRLAATLLACPWLVVDFIIAVSGNFKDTQGRPITKW